MGYACPVCGEPQVDAEHLANHLAFTAILRGGDHEAWLDETAGDWGDMEPAALADVVVEDAEEIEIEGVEETAHAGDSREAVRDSGGIARRETQLDRLSAEDRAILEEARELTRKMLESEPGEAEADSIGDRESNPGASDSEKE